MGLDTFSGCAFSPVVFRSVASSTYPIYRRDNQQPEREEHVPDATGKHPNEVRNRANPSGHFNGRDQTIELHARTHGSADHTRAFRRTSFS